MIINAHCHRNLSDESCIQVAIYDDRLEVTSPGGLYNGLTYEEVMSGHSKIRNKLIANVFSQMGLVEAWGSGIRRIISAAGEYGLPVPTVEVFDDMFRVNLYRSVQDNAKGGENSNSTFEYLDFDMIKQNPKIICGYSDITSLTNIITQKTGLITYSSTNFKTVATDETDYSLKQVLKRFVDGDLQLGEEADYRIIQKGNVEGQLIGGNLSLTKALVAGKYNIDFTDKILFLEELGLETCPALANNYLYYMKQNDILNK